MDFKQRPEDVGTPAHRNEVLRETISTYALALVVAAYFLWTFGTLTSSLGVVAGTYLIVATGFATSLGAAAGELLI